jgi:hypothetical protein
MGIFFYIEVPMKTHVYFIVDVYVLVLYVFIP